MGFGGYLLRNNREIRARLCFVFILTVYNLFITRVSQRDHRVPRFVKTGRDSDQLNAATTRTWKSTKEIEKSPAGRRFFKVNY